MNPKAPLSPQEITALLAQMQPTGQGYPPELLARRRSAYLQLAASLPIVPGVLSGKAFKNLHKNISKNLHAGITTSLEAVMQSVLGVMLAGLVVTAAIVYREEIVDFFTPDAGGAVSSEVAPLTFESTPSPTPAPLTLTAIKRYPYPVTVTSSPTPVPDESGDDGTGKKLGHTPTPPGQRSPQQPQKPQKP